MAKVSTSLEPQVDLLRRFSAGTPVEDMLMSAKTVRDS